MKKSKKLILSIICAALAITMGVLVVYALVSKQAEGSSDNDFTAGYVSCQVISDGTSYTIQNTSNTEAYIRAAVLVNWKKADGSYLAKPTNTTFTSESNWSHTTVTGTENSYYYYTVKVPAQEYTTKLIVDSSTINANNTAPEAGATLEIKVVAEAIQATKGTYSEAWQFTSSNGGITEERPPVAPEDPIDPTTCDHAWMDATCDTAKMCSKCGTTEGSPLGHLEVTLPAKDPTCTDTGLTAGLKCSRCSKIFTAQQIVPALEHNYVNNKCTRCGHENYIPDVTINRTEHSPYEYHKCNSCGYISSEDGTSVIGNARIDAFISQSDKNANLISGYSKGMTVQLTPSNTGVYDFWGWVPFDTSNYTMGWLIGDDDLRWYGSNEYTREEAVYQTAISEGYSYATGFKYYLGESAFQSGETIHLLFRDNNTGLEYCFAEFKVIKPNQNATTALGSVDGFKHQTTLSEYKSQATHANAIITVNEQTGTMDIGGWLATTVTSYKASWRLNEEYREYSLLAFSPRADQEAHNAAKDLLGSSAQALQFTYYLGLENIKSGDTIYLFLEDTTNGAQYCFASFTIIKKDNTGNYTLLDTMKKPVNIVTPTAPSQPSTEDANLKLWFDHLTEKVARYDTSNRNSTNSSYVIQMAKNEMEGCHFFLYHPQNKKITISLTDFTNSAGETLETELGVEFYYQQYSMNNKDFYEGTTDPYGKKIAVYPDGVVPYESYIKSGYGGDEGGSYEYGEWVPIGPYSENPSDTTKYPYREAIRGFTITAITTKNTTPGKYSATLTIYDQTTGQPIKTANVYTYVYNVTLNDEPALDTYIGVWYSNYEETNKKFGIRSQDAIVAMADFMLQYRLTPNFSGWAYEAYFGTEWCYNPRVTTVRVNKALYDKWKNDPAIAPKMVYYGQDEPGAPRNQGRPITLANGSSVNYHDTYGFLAMLGVAEEAKMLKDLWGWSDYRLIAPCERNPDFTDLANYPNLMKDGVLNISWDTIYNSLTTDAAKNFYNQYKDELQNSTDMFEFLSKYLTVWVYTYTGSTPRVQSSLSHCYYMQSATHDLVFGEFEERMRKYKSSGDEIWGYVACEPQWHSPYQNILLFNDGTEARTMFWTSYKLGQTGWLYWREDYYPGITDNTYALRNPFSATGPGDGILLYPGGIYGQIDPIPSIRMMNMRDGIEDYELLCMIEDKYGEAKAMEIVENIVQSVVNFSRNDQDIYNVHAQILKLLEQ